jgi:hypothetical protein
MTAPLGLQGQKIGSATNQNFATAANVYGVEVLLAAALRISGQVPGGTAYPILTGQIISYENAIAPTTTATTVKTPGTLLFPSTWVPGQVYMFTRMQVNGVNENGGSMNVQLQSETPENGDGLVLFSASSIGGPMVANTAGSLVNGTKFLGNFCWDKLTYYLRFTGVSSVKRSFDFYLYGIVYP